MAEAPILVLGATGGQGGAVADALLARGARVRAMVRRPAEPKARRLAERGVEVLAGSLGDSSALGAAMRGVLGVFALTTPFEAGVNADPGRIWRHRRAGSHLVRRSPPRPTSSTTRSAARHRIQAGILDLPLPPDRPLQQLARQDLGAFVAKVLRDPGPYVRQRIELASDAVTPAHMAEALSAAGVDRCATKKHHLSRSAVRTCTRCGGSSTAPAIASTSRLCTALTPILPGHRSPTGPSTPLTRYRAKPQSVLTLLLRGRTKFGSPPIASKTETHSLPGNYVTVIFLLAVSPVTHAVTQHVSPSWITTVIHGKSLHIRYHIVQHLNPAVRRRPPAADGCSSPVTATPPAAAAAAAAIRPRDAQTNPTT